MRQFFCFVTRLLVLVAMTGVVPLLGQEMEYLDREDVKQVMEQIFDRHINKKEMTEEILQDIFTPLFSTKGFGVGLGMVIVKNIIDQHKGDILIDSKSGEGTTVTLHLPLNLS